MESSGITWYLIYIYQETYIWAHNVQNVQKQNWQRVPTDNQISPSLMEIYEIYKELENANMTTYQASFHLHAKLHIC